MSNCRPQPGSLTNQKVYTLTAYLLAGNKLIGETDVIDAQTLSKVKMPNKDNFIVRFPERISFHSRKKVSKRNPACSCASAQARRER